MATSTKAYVASAASTNINTHGDCGQGKRLDARPFVSASPSRAVPSRVGVCAAALVAA